MAELARTPLERFEALSSTLLDEIAARGADERVHSDQWPTVGAIAGHVATIYGWAAAILRTGRPAERGETVLDDEMMTAVLLEARTSLLEELRGDERECWIIGGGTGTSAFWRRRMVLETLKHLLDVRTRPDERFTVPAELLPDLAAEGLDEFFDVFLARSRSSLAPLPGPVLLTSTDTTQSWRLESDWSVNAGDSSEADTTHATVEGSTAALLLLLWQRASALDESDRFQIAGDRGIVRFLECAPIHP